MVPRLVWAEEAGFDLFITADQEIGYQQNLTRRRIALLAQFPEGFFLSTLDTDAANGSARQ